MKKLFALILAVLMVTVSVSALAAGSKTTNDVAKTTVNTEEGLVIKIVEPSEEETAFFAKMTAGDPETLPEGAQAEELTELLALLVSGAKEGIGDHVANLVPTTFFEMGQKVHAYMGILKEEKAAWQELTPVEIIEDGSLDLPFTEEQLITMQNAKDVVLAIFVETAE